MMRGATVLACLLGLTCTAFAQNSRPTSTAFANLTLVRQNDANFSSDVKVPSFPCDSSSTGLVGGYKPLDLDDVNLYYVTQAVLKYFVGATANITDCDYFVKGAYNVTDACSQVVQGTNYALEVQSFHGCLGNSNTTLTIDEEPEILSIFDSPLRATVYLPLPEASPDLDGAVTYTPVIRDIWFEMPPAVTSYNISAPAAAPAAVTAPPTGPSSASNGSTTLLTDDSGVGTSTGTLQFVPSPAAPGSQSPPEPEPVTGLDVEDQEQSLASG